MNGKEMAFWRIPVPIRGLFVLDELEWSVPFDLDFGVSL
jgi:hypothetical protein